MAEHPGICDVGRGREARDRGTGVVLSEAEGSLNGIGTGDRSDWADQAAGLDSRCLRSCGE